jgi:hypothetical protein
MIPGQALSVAELRLSPMTILATVTVSSEKECVGDLTAEAAGHVHELDEADNSWFGQCQSFTSNHVARIGFDDLRLTVDY